MEKILEIFSLYEKSNDYEYWLSRPISERLEAIEILVINISNLIKLNRAFKRCVEQ